MSSTPMYGYIYVRNHPSYDLENACKLGKASNIPERDTQYATGELRRGYFDPVFEIPLADMSRVEHSLQNEFSQWHVKYNAGTEFYDKDIIPLIEPYFTKMAIPFRKLTLDEIHGLVRCRRDRSPPTHNGAESAEGSERCSPENTPIAVTTLPAPREYQVEIIQNACEFYQTNDKGILLLMCGMGKTFISLWIAQELRVTTLLIGVPNVLLLEQWQQVVSLLFPYTPTLIVSSGVKTEDITQFLRNHDKRCIVITTYASSHKILASTVNLPSFAFHVKINDECHHLTTTNMALADTSKTYVQMLHIPCIKQISLTATLKQLECLPKQALLAEGNRQNTKFEELSVLEGDDEDNLYVSNNNRHYFGEIIDRKCLLWAIQNNIICDYVIQTIITDEEKLDQQIQQFHIVDENDKRLFLSAMAALKSICENHSHHLLIYTNNKENSQKVVQYVQMLLEDQYFGAMGDHTYCSSYHSDISAKSQVDILQKFKQSRFGIILCVYCLGEGWDFPLLDGVVFAENMSSNIRIVQSALRASRKYKDDVHKKTKIILPILNREDWLENNQNPDLKRVREIIYQMGLEDESIAQKIKVVRVDMDRQTMTPRMNPNDSYEMVEDFGEYDEEFTQKLRLKTLKRTELSTTYEKARKIIAGKLILTKEEYFKLCEVDNRLSKEPEVVFKGQFTNWIEYLSIPRIFYDLDTCIEKVSEYLSLHPDIKRNYLDLSEICQVLSHLDGGFPPNGLWVEYYQVKDLSEIIVIKTTKKKKGCGEP